MFNELEPYIHHEFSSVQWPGDVPAHWTVRRLKNTKTVKSVLLLRTLKVGPEDMKKLDLNRPGNPGR